MLVGLLPPTSGDALIFGKNIVSNIVSFKFCTFATIVFANRHKYHLLKNLEEPK